MHSYNINITVIIDNYDAIIIGSVVIKESLLRTINNNSFPFPLMIKYILWNILWSHSNYTMINILTLAAVADGSTPRDPEPPTEI